MTVPKLRVFVKDLAKMFLPDDIVYIDYNEKTVTVRGCNHSDCDTCHDEYSWEQCEIMRFTDILDDSEPRKGIFEGDVVNAYDLERDEGRIYKTVDLVGVIEYKGNSFCLKDNKGIYNDLWVNAEEYEVLGNIHQHPHLVED